MQEVIWCPVGSWESHCPRCQMICRQKEKSPRKTNEKWMQEVYELEKQTIVTIRFSVTTASDNKCPTNLDCFIVDEGVNCFVASFWICLVHDHPKLGPESIQHEHQGLPVHKACTLSPYPSNKNIFFSVVHSPEYFNELRAVAVESDQIQQTAEAMRTQNKRISSNSHHLSLVCLRTVPICLYSVSEQSPSVYFLSQNSPHLSIFCLRTVPICLYSVSEQSPSVSSLLQNSPHLSLGCLQTVPICL